MYTQSEIEAVLASVANQDVPVLPDDVTISHKYNMVAYHSDGDTVVSHYNGLDNTIDYDVRRLEGLIYPCTVNDRYIIEVFDDTIIVREIKFGATVVVGSFYNDGSVTAANDILVNQLSRKEGVSYFNVYIGIHIEGWKHQPSKTITGLPGKMVLSEDGLYLAVLSTDMGIVNVYKTTGVNPNAVASVQASKNSTIGFANTNDVLHIVDTVDGKQQIAEVRLSQ